ncbi:MAG TPA: FKBP-type peptidyl-prolyl cis-trans isomerase [Chitinophagaceae bacterium]
MKYNKWLIPAIIIVLVNTGCGKLDYNKTKSGLLYKIMSTKDTKGPLARQGNVLKFYYSEKIDDSLARTNFGQSPAYAPAVTFGADDYSPAEIFHLLHNGDSAVAVMLVDSLILKGKLPNLPPYLKRGGRITYSFKIVDLFASDSLSNIDRRKAMDKEISVETEKGKKQVEDYLAANKINAKSTPKGAYVEVMDPGNGMAADSGKVVLVKYKGTTLTGKVFDTNMDSSFHHTEPLQFVEGAGGIFPGFDDGIRGLKKGAKAKIFIPGALGNGPNPVLPGGQPYENLIFDIDVVDVKDKPEMPKLSTVPKIPLQKIDTSHRKK